LTFVWFEHLFFPVYVAEDPLPDDVLSDLQEKLQEVLESTVKKYDLNYQIEESKKILTEKLDELSCKSELLNGTVCKLMMSLCVYCLVYLCSVVHCDEE
jgi:hypothetical protein